jgi:hypothetical protein
MGGNVGNPDQRANLYEPIPQLPRTSTKHLPERHCHATVHRQLLGRSNE